MRNVYIRLLPAGAVIAMIMTLVVACGPLGSSGDKVDSPDELVSTAMSAGATQVGAIATTVTQIAPPAVATAFAPLASLTPPSVPTLQAALTDLSAAALEANAVTLEPTDEPPLLTQQEAMQVVADFGVPWALGGQWDGKEVTVTAAYGLATFGGLGLTGFWEGASNIPLPSGELLERIEQRPMWIIDYGNTVFFAAGCPGCPPPPDYNHSVYAVDAETEALLAMWAYVGD